MPFILDAAHRRTVPGEAGTHAGRDGESLRWRPYASSSRTAARSLHRRRHRSEEDDTTAELFFEIP